MAKEFAKAFYNSKRWQDCRKAYIDKRVMIDGGLCERCKRVTGYILHHKIELTPQNINDVDITLNHCNLEYVCHDCHNDEHRDEFSNAKIKGGLMNKLDANGRVIPDPSR